MPEMNQYQAFKILRESGLVLEKKLRSEMTPEELADARAKSKERRLLRKARKEGEKKVLDQLGLTHDDLKKQEPKKEEPKKSGLSPEDSKAIAAGYKKYEDEYNDYLDNLDRRVRLKDNQTYEKQKELLDELNRKTWLFKDVRVSYKTEEIYQDIKDRVERYRPKPTGDMAKLELFRKAFPGDCEEVDGKLEITTRDFCFSIKPDLSYDMTVFNCGYDGDGEVDLSGKFKENVLEKDPEYIHDYLQRKAERVQNEE